MEGQLNRPNIFALTKARLAPFHFKVALLVVPLLAGTTAQPAQGQRIKITKINPPGATYSWASGLNRQGKTVVGAFTNAKGVLAGFEYVQSKYHTIVYPGAVKYTEANDVNDSNTIVGAFVGKDGYFHGYLLRGAKFTRYDVSKKAHVSTVIYGINNGGNFVGYTAPQGVDDIGFVKVGGKLTQFRVKGDTTIPFAINNSNDIVGLMIDPPPLSYSHGFHRDAKGKAIQIDFPGSHQTSCLGINDAGEITGLYVDSNNVAHGYTLIKGKFKTSTLPDIGKINDSGMFVGSYTSHSGQTYGYLARP